MADKLIDFISGKEVNATPEEIDAVQVFSRSLVNDYTRQHCVQVYNMDINDFIDTVILQRQNDLFVNFDPPYVNKGEVLYKNYFKEEDHKQLANKITTNLQNVQWIMTYDDCELIKDLYKDYNPQNFNLQYYAGTKRLGKELLISNLHK